MNNVQCTIDVGANSVRPPKGASKMINQIQNTLQPLQPASPLLGGNKIQEQSDINISAPTFLDIFKNIVGETADAQNQKAKDMLDLMLGDVDDLERIQTNITKAQISLELLTNVRNATLEAYNEIIKMSI